MRRSRPTVPPEGSRRASGGQRPSSGHCCPDCCPGADCRRRSADCRYHTTGLMGWGRTERRRLFEYSTCAVVLGFEQRRLGPRYRDRRLAHSYSRGRMRQRLPDRRLHELFEIDHAGIHYAVGVGRFENGEQSESFLSAPRTGTAAAVNAQDAAIAASLLFQHGCTAETLRKALTRNPDGTAAGPLGAVLDLLSGGKT